MGERGKVGENCLTSSNSLGSGWLGAAAKSAWSTRRTLTRSFSPGAFARTCRLQCGTLSNYHGLPVADIAEHERSSAPRRDLEQLSSDAGARVLRALGVKGPEAELRSASD